MNGKSIKAIVTLTVILWLVGTSVYFVYWINREMGKAEFFHVLVLVEFITGILPLSLSGLFLVVVVELTVLWAMWPVRDKA